MVGTRTAGEIRQDLAAGLAAAVAEKGYAASTIADIVTHARVSKRTFYEQFPDKEACLMALYEQGCQHLINVLRGAASHQPRLRDRVRDAVHAYLTALEQMPAATRTLLVEIQAAGPSAYRLRQRMQRRFADTLVEMVAHGRSIVPAENAAAPLSPTMALALTGGINELLLQVSDPYTGDGVPFTTLAEEIEHLVFAVLSAPWTRAGSPAGEQTGFARPERDTEQARTEQDRPEEAGPGAQPE